MSLCQEAYRRGATVALVFFGPQLAWALSLIGTQVDKAG